MRFNQLKETEKALIKPGTELEKTEEIIKKTFSPERQKVNAEVMALARMAEMGKGDKSELLMKITALTKREMDVKKDDPDLAHGVDSNIKILTMAVEKLTGSKMDEAWNTIKAIKLVPKMEEMYNKFVKVDEADKSARGLIALKKQYDELTDENQHGEAALALARTLGTSDDVEIIQAINARHMKRGSISRGEQTLRDEIANSLYKTMMQGQFDLPEDVSEDTADYEKVMARQTHKHLKVISEHRRMLENMIIKLAEMDKGTGDLTDQLTTMFDLNTKFSAVLRRAIAIVPVYEGTDDGRKKGIHPKGHPMRKKQQAAIAISKKGESIGERSEKQDAFSAKEIKMAIGIASDPRYAKGNMTGAVNAIEKLSKGLSKHKQVAAVLKRQNEALDLDSSLSEHLKEHGIVKEYGDKEMLMGMNMNYVLINMQNKVQGYASDKKDALDIAKRTKSTMHPIKKKITDKTLEKMNALAMTPKQLADLGIIDEEDEPDLGRPVTGSDNHIMGSEGHPVPLLAKVAKQIAMDHADQDYTAIDELFKRTPSKELESFLSEFGESMNEAIPTSEYDYDIKKFFDKVQELEDENQHGEVAKMLTQLYGTSSELMIINGINGMHAKEGSIGPEAQKLRDKISTKYYYQAQKEVEKLKKTSPAYTMRNDQDGPDEEQRDRTRAANTDEGFASDAQRKAAFASGYKPTGKKKKTETKTKNIDFGRMISGKGPKPKDVKTESMQSKFRKFLKGKK